MVYQFFTMSFFLMLMSIADVWSIPGNCVPITRRRTIQSSNTSSVLEDHKNNSGDTAELGHSQALKEYSHASTTHSPLAPNSVNDTSLTYSSGYHTASSVQRSKETGLGRVERSDNSIMRVNSEHLNITSPEQAAGILCVTSGAPTKAMSAPHIVREQCSRCGTIIATFPGGDDVCIACKKRESVHTTPSTHAQSHKPRPLGNVRDCSTCDDRVN